MERYEYRVREKRVETPSTSTLALELVGGAIPSHRAGQYLTVYFPDMSPVFGKEYTISSAPCEREFTITVKAIGRYSGRLCSLKPGDTFLASKPQGSFYPQGARSLYLLAGGMGVTPFRSIIVDALHAKRPGTMRLLYSGRYASDMPFSRELNRLASESPSFQCDRFITRDTAIPRGAKSRRIRPDDIDNSVACVSSSEYLVSGSIEFVCDVKGLLSSIAIPTERIITEVCA